MVRRFLLLAGVLVVGCSNKLTGELTYKGKSFVPIRCSNMQRIGQRGVELEDASYRRVRIIERPDGGADAYWFSDSSGKGIKFGDCAKLTLNEQNSSVNKVHNVMGKVKLECEKSDDELTGTVTFENCH